MSILKQLALRLGGVYHNGNEKHLPTEVLDKLTLTSPRTSLGIGLREAGLIAVGGGAAVLALLAPALILFGRPASWHRARADVSRRARRAGEARGSGVALGAPEVAQ